MIFCWYHCFSCNLSPGHSALLTVIECWYLVVLFIRIQMNVVAINVWSDSWIYSCFHSLRNDFHVCSSQLMYMVSQNQGVRFLSQIYLPSLKNFVIKWLQRSHHNLNLRYSASWNITDRKLGCHVHYLWWSCTKVNFPESWRRQQLQFFRQVCYYSNLFY